MAPQTLPERDVVRCAKQIYNHLDLRDRIPLLSQYVRNLPPEVQKMQTLCLTDKAELNNVVRKFLQWTPPPGSKKTIQDLIQRLDGAILAYCSLGDDDGEEQLQVNTNVQKRPATTDTDDNNASKRFRSDSVSSATSSLASLDQSISTTTSLSPLTPPLSPFDTSSSDNQDFNVLCSPPRKTKYLDGVNWTVRFEIARFMTTCRVSWQDLSFEVLQRFMDVAKSEPRDLFQTMMQWYGGKTGTPQGGITFGLMERCSDHVWNHLDKRAQTLDGHVNANANRMIHYGAVMALSHGKPPVIQLRPPKVGASNRFFRKYGEHRFLELKLNKTTHPSLIRQHMNFFLKPFLLMGQTFKFLFVKDDTVVLFATEGNGLEPISIRQVVDWHIPILENWNMTISKFASRMSLGYSNSIPTLVFAPENIHYIDDVYSGAEGQEETCMTDGCGLISVSAMRKIMGSQKDDELPCAVQGRIGGAKGIWIVSPDLDFNSGDWIKIRKSQHKFKTGLRQYDMSTDPLHYTFDLVKNSICIYPSNLNTQFIQCLSSGGVPTSVFVDLLKEYLQRLAMVVTENKNIRVLRDWVAKTGSIMQARWELEDTEKDIWRDQSSVDDEYVECRSNEDELIENPMQKTNGDYWKINAYSGLPAALHESTVRLLDSGFDLSNPYVANKVTHIFRDVMRSVTTKYKIEVLQSCTVTCIADPTGTLEPGQIYLNLSSRRVDEKTGIRAGLVVGDVIVTRNPCGLKSDVQKVKAVDCTALRMYTDVIVFPIKGERSLASMLGGGDYDGDIVFCCWDQRIVQPFNASPVPKEPERMKNAFDINTTKVRQELGKYRDEAGQELALQKSFMSITLPDGTLGLYENWRTVLAEMTSLENEDVIYLAHMCAKLVDAPKQGYALKQTVLRRDRNDFAKTPHPAWFLDKRNKQREKHFKIYQEVNKDVIPAEDRLVTAMDHLHDTLLKETEAFTKYSRSMFVEDDVKLKDPDLASPWTSAMQMAIELNDQDLKQDLLDIQQQIDKNFEEYNHDIKELCLRQRNKQDSRYDPARPTEPFLADMSQFNTLFELEEYFAREFQVIPETIRSNTFKIDKLVNGGQMLQTVKASYAYIRTIQNEKYSKYCYIVAFDCLRRMKADARARTVKSNGMSEAVVPYMYTAMNLDRGWIKKLKENKSSTDCGTAQVRVAYNISKELKT